MFLFTTHRKLLVAIVGLCLLVAKDYLNFDLPDSDADSVVNTFIALLTAIGVERVPNS